MKAKRTLLIVSIIATVLGTLTIDVAIGCGIIFFLLGILGLICYAVNQ